MELFSSTQLLFVAVQQRAATQEGLGVLQAKMPSAFSETQDQTS